MSRRKLGGISPLLCCHTQNTGRVPNTQKMFYDTSDWKNTHRKEQSHIISQPFLSRQQWDSMENKWRLDSQMFFMRKREKKSNTYLLYKVSDLNNVLRFVKIPNTAITVWGLNMIFINLCLIALFPFSLFILNNPELWLIVRHISGWSQVKRSSVWFRSVILCYKVFHV